MLFLFYQGLQKKMYRKILSAISYLKIFYQLRMAMLNDVMILILVYIPS